QLRSLWLRWCSSCETSGPWPLLPIKRRLIRTPVWILDADRFAPAGSEPVMPSPRGDHPGVYAAVARRFRACEKKQVAAGNFYLAIALLCCGAIRPLFFRNRKAQLPNVALSPDFSTMVL